MLTRSRVRAHPWPEPAFVHLEDNGIFDKVVETTEHYSAVRSVRYKTSGHVDGIKALASIGIDDHANPLTLKLCTSQYVDNGKPFLQIMNSGSTADELLYNLGKFCPRLTNVLNEIQENSGEHVCTDDALIEAIVRCRYVSRKSMTEQLSREHNGLGVKKFSGCTYGDEGTGSRDFQYYMACCDEKDWIAIECVSPGIRVSYAVVFELVDYENFVSDCDGFRGIYATCETGDVEFNVFPPKNDRIYENEIDVNDLSMVGDDVVHSKFGKLTFHYGQI